MEGFYGKDNHVLVYTNLFKLDCVESYLAYRNMLESVSWVANQILAPSCGLKRSQKNPRPWRDSNTQPSDLESDAQPLDHCSSAPMSKAT